MWSRFQLRKLEGRHENINFGGAPTHPAFVYIHFQDVGDCDGRVLTLSTTKMTPSLYVHLETLFAAEQSMTVLDLCSFDILQGQLNFRSQLIH